MMNRGIIKALMLSICLAFFLSVKSAAQSIGSYDNDSQHIRVSYVNPLIVTGGIGHTFPGACAPFGIVQLSPETDTIPHNIEGRYQKKVYD